MTTDLRELRDGRRPSVFGVSCAESGVSVGASACDVAEASSYTSVVCSSFVTSDMTLAPSSRLVGGVEMGGDALDVARAPVCWTAVLDSMDEVDMGEPSRSAIVVGGSLCGSRGKCVVARQGSDAQRRSPVLRALAEQQCQSTRVAGTHALPNRCRRVNQACTEVRADATSIATPSEVDCELRVGRRREPI